ncbi:MAG: putative PIG3 family NAD(P)H quinone oxidoreductase [Candidatus Azotimanducaceae bacterium]|jgi:putative PIG3 family NAD(P)H quinone oxidoreductase
MYAIQVDGEQLAWAAFEPSECHEGEVRIGVQATAINRADLIQRSGGYPPPPGASPIMGLECAGEVLEVGEGVTRVQVGDSVCALLSGGGYATEVVVPAGQVLPIPAGLSMAQAAAIPEVFATAYLNLYMEGALKAGEHVLLHAGASGVGTAAIQLLKQSGNPSYVTAGGADKIDQCIALGADGGFDRHNGSFVDDVRAWAGEAGVDLVLDPVGAGYLADNLTVLALGGRLVLIGLMSGAQTEISLGALMMKRARIIGSTLRARPIAEKALVMDGLARDVWPDLAAGDIKPIIEAKFPIEETAKAHELLASNTTVGKVVLEIS